MLTLVAQIHTVVPYKRIHSHCHNISYTLPGALKILPNCCKNSNWELLGIEEFGAIRTLVETVEVGVSGERSFDDGCGGWCWVDGSSALRSDRRDCDSRGDDG